VPSFLLQKISASNADLGKLMVDVSYGDFYAIVDVQENFADLNTMAQIN
jgi:proline racemase